MNREFAPSAAQLRLEAGSDGSAQLFCGKRALLPGCNVTALFPGGWHEIVLNVKMEADGSRRWYIATPDFSPYSPVGLFAQGPERNADGETL